MDILLMVVCVVAAILLCLINVYVMAYYSHSDDRNTCTVVFCKVIVVLTLLQCQSQELLLMLDASNSRGSGAGFNMTLMWQIFYLAVWCNLGFLLPLAVFLYETDDEKSACQRIATTICEVIITVGVVCVLTFVSWFYLKGASIPLELLTTSGIEEDTAALITIYPALTETTVNLSIAIPYYITGLMVFFGYLVLICCGGCGLTALPLDLILQFRMRPRWRRTSEANAKKQELRMIIEDLTRTGEHLKKQMKQADYETSWWSRRKASARLSKEFSNFEQLAMEQNEHFQLFKLELRMSISNPFVYIGKVVLGCFCIFLTVLWWLQILFSELVLVNGRPLTYMVDSLLLYFEANNAGFAGVIVFMVMTQYLVLCIIKGSFSFGMQIPYLFSFHPMAEARTWMNSFLFNCALSVLGSTAISHLCAGCFPQYMRGTEIQAMLLSQVNYLKFFSVFFENKVFIYALLIWSALVSIFIIIRGVRKPELLKLIEEKRKKLKLPTVEIQMQSLSEKKPKSNKVERGPEKKGDGQKKKKPNNKSTVRVVRKDKD